MGEQVLLGEEALGQVLRDLLGHVGEFVQVVHGLVFDVGGGEGVGKRVIRRFVVLPSLAQVDDHVAHVQTDDPVVRKELVHDFAHDCLLFVQNVGLEVEQDVEHCGLFHKWIEGSC